MPLRKCHLMPQWHYVGIARGGGTGAGLCIPWQFLWSINLIHWLQSAHRACKPVKCHPSLYRQQPRGLAKVGISPCKVAYICHQVNRCTVVPLQKNWWCPLSGHLTVASTLLSRPLAPLLLPLWEITSWAVASNGTCHCNLGWHNFPV